MEGFGIAPPSRAKLIAMATKKSLAKKAATAFTLTLDKRRGKILLTMLGAIELRMFEKGFRPSEGQMKAVSEFRRELSGQIYGQPEASLEEQLAAAVEFAKEKRPSV
ncbi:MAG TPA: hypothetical protein VER03_04095 [Bryobacteraceae bacterium]|nr:hypothetical protein [Bryobacteraceae bacterium]